MLIGWQSVRGTDAKLRAYNPIISVALALMPAKSFGEPVGLEKSNPTAHAFGYEVSAAKVDKSKYAQNFNPVKFVRIVRCIKGPAPTRARHAQSFRENV
ncbi:hypothetical protein PQQ71_22335 [Paraburkholderia dipogonis]